MPAVYGEPMQGKPGSFHNRRRTGIGGSDAGAILGLSPWSSPLSVWEEKRGLGSELEASEPMIWGNRLEAAIAQGWSEDHGIKVTKGRFSRSKAHPFMVGHPDYEADDRIIEVKMTHHLDDRWGPEGSDKVPAHYFAQVQHYMAVREADLATLVVLEGGNRLREYTIPAVPVFQQAMIEEEAAFWELVKVGVPPAPDGSAASAAALKVLYPVAKELTVEAPPEVEELLGQYVKAADATKRWEQEKSRLGQLVQGWMGEASKVTSPTYKASWPTRKGSISWKQAAEHIHGGWRDLMVPYLSDDALDEVQARIQERAEAEAKAEDGRGGFTVREVK